MGRGKNINLFLMDGEVTGKIKCTLSNWTGVIFKIPRKLLSEMKGRSEMSQDGIYFLLGKDETTNKDLVYIGQAGTRKNGEGVWIRIAEHTRDKHSEYFNDVIVLTTQNNSFGPTELNYLENKFTNRANESKRYSVINSNEPNQGNVTEEKEAELDEVIENTITIIGALGHKIFVPISEEKNVNKYEEYEDEDIYHLKRKIKKYNIEIKAKCKRTNEGFVVLRGSKINTKGEKNISNSIISRRNELLEKGEIRDGILISDQLFDSPSTAAIFVIGNSANGRVEWKKEDGRTLKEIEESELQ